ncbi:MAG: L,D-transpeptidase family protein [Gaiellaceae bacterium]
MRRRAKHAALLLACSLAGLLLAAQLASTAIADEGTDTSTTSTTSTTGGDTTTTETTTTATTTTATTPAPVVVPAGVRVGGVAIGGMSPAEARATLGDVFSTPLSLRLGKRMLTLSPRSLGASADFRAVVSRALRGAPHRTLPPNVRVAVTRVRDAVASLARRLDRQPLDSRLLLRGARPWITPGRSGLSIRRRQAVTDILSRLRLNERQVVRLQAKELSQKVSRKGFGPLIVIHRGSNLLFLYHGMQLWRRFQVATGQSAYPTPLGSFHVIVMWRNPWWYPPNSPWAQGEKPVPPGPGNPLGTRWMGISAPGVGIHGTPDPASIGYSASHGCIRMRIPEAEWLFQHVKIGTPVFIVPA